MSVLAEKIMDACYKSSFTVYAREPYDFTAFNNLGVGLKFTFNYEGTELLRVEIIQR